MAWNHSSIFKLFVAMTFLFALGCGQDGCQSPSKESSALPSSGGTVIIAIPSDPGVLNPLLSSSSLAGYISSEMQDTLVELDENLVYQPRIATSWALASDGLSLTFSLQPWQWSDGHALKARDVVSSFNLFKNPLVGSPRAGDLSGVLRAVAVDSATVRYEFDQPYPDVMAKTVHSLLPAHVTDDLDPRQVDSWPLNQLPLSSGAFMIDSWKHNQSIVLVRNPFYSLNPSLLDKVVFKIIPETDAQVLALETGEVDFVSNIPPHLVTRIKHQTNLNIKEIRGRLFYYLSWNFSNSMFENPHVRKALSLALDRERMGSDLLSGFAQPAFGPLPPGLWNHNTNLQADPYNPEKARQILEGEGWVDHNGDGIREKDGLKFSFEILSRTGDPFRDLGGVILMENFKAIGVEVKLRSLEQSAANSRLVNGKFDGFFGRFRANVYGNPASLVHSASFDRFNAGHYANSKVDSLLDLAIVTIEPKESLPIWYQLQELLTQDQPAAYLVYPVNLVGTSARVQDIQPHMLSPYNNLEKWWISPQDRKYRSK